MSKENEFDFTIPKERQPDYLAELVSVIVEDFDNLIISDKSKEEISRRIKEFYDQVRLETIRETEERITQVKEAVSKNTGSYKYNSCYDDCLDILNQMKALPNKLK